MANILVPLFLWLFVHSKFHSVLGERTPQITWISQDQEVYKGSFTQLKCSVQFAEWNPIVWVKEGTGSGVQDLPISVGASLIFRDSRYSVKHDQASSTYILQIKDIQESDSGRYQCRIGTSSNTSITASVNLQVKSAPVILENSTRSVVVDQGQNAEFACYATGTPTPVISFSRENDPDLLMRAHIERGSNTLMIKNVRKEDSGIYYCTAENSLSQRGVKRKIVLEVMFSPVTKAINPTVYQTLHGDVGLECYIESYPPAAIRWMYKEEILFNGAHYRISQFASDDFTTTTILTVMDIEKRDFGNYTCAATNKFGQSGATVQLIESAEVQDFNEPKIDSESAEVQDFNEPKIDSGTAEQISNLKLVLEDWIEEAVAMSIRHEERIEKKITDTMTDILANITAQLSEMKNEVKKCNSLFDILYKSSRYYLSEYKVNYPDAIKECRERGGDLAKIDDDDEFNFLQNHLGENWTWIGLDDRTNEGLFKWTYGGTVHEPNDHRSWWHGPQPDNYGGKEHCVHFLWRDSALLLNDYRCDDVHLRYVCELKN